jgi:hypothetical protein
VDSDSGPGGPVHVSQRTNKQSQIKKKSGAARKQGVRYETESHASDPIDA